MSRRREASVYVTGVSRCSAWPVKEQLLTYRVVSILRLPALVPEGVLGENIALKATTRCIGTPPRLGL